jgi:NAD(P)-dependent dehydrogenase (short-subunit alcohol dehydrogenase family)
MSRINSDAAPGTGWAARRPLGKERVVGEQQALTILVTGAGGGVGRAIAERFARAGHRVLGTTRSADRVRALNEAARAAGFDLSYSRLEYPSAADIDALVRDVASRGRLDVLVNNAGSGVFGAVEHVGADDVARQFAVNLFGPLELTRRLLPLLRASRGRVVWIGSLGGRIALPFQAHYSATKASVAAVSDAMRVELKPLGVQVTCVEPGDFATGFTDARTIVDAAGSAYQAPQGRCLRAAEEQERSGPSPERVAVLVERLCRMRSMPARAPIGTFARTMCAALRLLPDRVREWAVRRTYRQ